jgi:tRNA(Arg) A34 adenosine deaminase TadA
MTHDPHAALLRRTIAVALAARAHGNHPFGALLADPAGHVLLEAENTVLTERDCTGHAETNLMRLASRQLPPEVLATATLYTSTEPCPMCAGAIYWGGVRRLVYCVGQAALYALMPPGAWALELNARDVFARAAGEVEVIGPLLEAEGLAVHAGFWS